MHFTTTSSFLATLLIVLSPVEALPVKRSAGMVTLPLKRVQPPSHDLHPRILLQQHINRSYRRFARMTGRAEPSDAELRSNIEERMNLLLTNVTNMGYSHKVNVPSGTHAVNQTNQAVNLVTRADTTPTNNSLGLDIVASDLGYFATIQIGTPPRDYNILMDSGSADFWVGGESCQSPDTSSGCGEHISLGPDSSSSFVDLGTHFQTTYETRDSSVGGDIVTDNVVIAGLSLPGHQFGVAKTKTVPFSSSNTSYDGVMGLGRSILSTQSTPTPVEALASNHLIKEAITSYKISRLADNANDGEITFGGMDDTKYDPNTLVTVDNVNTQGYWEASMDSIFVNGADLGLQGRTAILDTGASFLLLPPQDVIAVHQLIDGAQTNASGTFTIPCNTTASVAFSFGGTQFTIDPRDLVIAEDTDSQTCRSSIIEHQFGNSTEWLVGDVFLKNVYLSTNGYMNQISLAKLL